MTVLHKPAVRACGLSRGGVHAAVHGLRHHCCCMSGLYTCLQPEPTASTSSLRGASDVKLCDVTVEVLMMLRLRLMLGSPFGPPEEQSSTLVRLRCQVRLMLNRVASVAPTF